MFDELQKHLRDNDLRSRETVRNVKAVLTNQVEATRRSVRGMELVKEQFALVGRKINTLQGWLYHWTSRINENLETNNASLDIIAEAVVNESKAAENRYQVLRHELKNTGGKIDYLNNKIVEVYSLVFEKSNLLKGMDKGIASIQIAFIFVILMLITMGVSQGYIIWKLNNGGAVQTNCQCTQGTGSQDSGGNPPVSKSP